MLNVDGALRGVRQEAMQLEQLFGDAFLAFGYGAAAKTQARSASLKKYHNSGNLLYISAHGSQEGAILLLDGWTGWQQFFAENDWNFSGQIAVILACSHLGQQNAIGKELLGMISAMSSRGAPALVAALWMVDDGATAILMPLFVKYLKQNWENQVEHPRSIALKSAMDELRSLDNGKYDVPYYFAPFFLSGLA